MVRETERAGIGRRDENPIFDTQSTITNSQENRRNNSQHNRQDSTEAPSSYGAGSTRDTGSTTRPSIRHRVFTRRSTLGLEDETVILGPPRTCDCTELSPDTCEICRDAVTSTLGQEQNLRSPEDFAHSVVNHSHEWFATVKALLEKTAIQTTYIGELQLQRDEYLAQKISETEMLRTTRNELRTLELKVSQANADLSRIRAHRTRLKEEKNQLKEQLDKAKHTLASFGHQQGHTRQDSTEATRPTSGPHPQHPPPPPSSFGMGNRSPWSGTHDAATVDNRYPDPGIYSGHESTTPYDEWEIKLLSWLRNKGISDTAQRIDRTRDRLTGEAWDLVLYRAHPESPEPYRSVDEMLAELRNSYGTYDKKHESETKLMNTAAIRQKPNENFTAVYSRFNQIIAPIRTSRSETSWVMTLRSLLNKKLQNRLQTGHVYTTLRELADASREIERSIEIADMTESPKPNTMGRGRNVNPRSPATPNSRPIKTVSFKRPNSLMRKLRAKGLCFNCGEAGHGTRSESRPCKNKSAVPNEELEARLATLNAEVELAVATTESDYDSADNDEDEERDDQDLGNEESLE